MLRERLSRFLPTHATPTGHASRPVRPRLSDGEVVDLFLNLELIAGDDIARARVAYEQASRAQLAAEANAPADSGEASQSEQDAATHASKALVTDEPEFSVTKAPTPDSPADSPTGPPSVALRVIHDTPTLERHSPPLPFDELVEQGWIRTSWGRFSVPRDIVMVVLRSSPNVAPAFRALVEMRTRDSFHLNEQYKPGDAARAIASSIVAGERQPGETDCVSRAWIAARLWDTPCKDQGAQDAAQRILHWVDRRAHLNWPVFALSEYVEPASISTFVDSALEVLAAPGATPGWDEFRQAARAPIALLYPHRAANDTSIIPPVPATLIDRIQWMSQHLQADAFHDLSETRASSLLVALLNQIQEATFDAQRLVPRLMAAIVERPVYLLLFVHRSNHAPALLADMLMAPTTCPLACSLIASWEVRGSAWNRDFQASADDTTVLLAFEDAIAVLGGHLDAGHTRTEELAALYLRIYQLASDPRKSPRHYTQLTLLREEIAAAPSAIQDSVVAALLALAHTEEGSTNAFCAALDLTGEGGCVDRIDATKMVSTYLDVVILKGDRLGIKQMDLKDACTLVTLALKSDATRDRFLGAVNVPAWLQAGPSPQERYTFNELLARRVRLHIRVLSRAIAGWPSAIPSSLVAALARTVHVGASDQPKRGRLDAFALEFAHGHPLLAQERPIALDLAAALRRLEERALQQLVIPLCQLEEPVVLAGIVANTPPSVHEPIKTHLLTLTPENSSRAATLPALQARIDALLNAQLPDLAEVFIAAEREVAPGRAIPQRALSGLRSTLFALLVREDWPAIASFVLPASITEVEKQEATDMVRFFQAIAELRKPGGSPAAAEATFLELTRRHHAVTAYHTNLFASRVQRLLARDALGLLSGGQRPPQRGATCGAAVASALGL
jgi:hypothetical protein